MKPLELLTTVNFMTQLIAKEEFLVTTLSTHNVLLELLYYSTRSRTVVTG